MRAALIIAFAAACAGAAPERAEDTTYISIGTDALATARGVVERGGAPLEVLAARDGVAVLAVGGEADLAALSETMHERHDRCGGYMVHASLEDARASLAAPTPRVAVDYTLDQAETVASVLPVIEEARILETIRALSAMKNRYFQSESGKTAARWLRERWRSFTARRDVSVELFDHGYAQPSVILTIPGTTRASEVVVIGGHLDSISLGGKSGTAPGADDDASGIATLTEVARVLLARDYRPARTVMFMAYAAEEVGLRGSLSIAREFQRRGVNVVGALQLDMTNYQGSDRDIWLIDDYTSPAQNAFLVRLIEAYVGATWGSDVCGYACSDHASWHRAGIPASMPFESRSSQRNQKIHTKLDTLETSGNNAAHAVKFARLAAAYTIELAKTERGPSVSPAIVAAAGDQRGAGSVRGLLGTLAVGLALAFALGRLVRAVASRGSAT